MRRKFNMIFKIFIIIFIIISMGSVSFGSYLNISNEEYQRRLDRARELRESVGFVTSSNSTSSQAVEYVFITEDNAKYHKAGCDYMNGRPHKVTLQYARQNGYGACNHCYGLEDNNSYDSVFIITTIIVSIFIILLVGFGFYGYYKNKHVDMNNCNIKQ